MTSIVAAYVSCGRVSEAFLAISEPERQEVTRCQGHRPKGVGYLTGAIIVDSVLKLLTSGENRAILKNSGRVVAYAMDYSSYMCFLHIL
jgi:hypothetical protein